MSAVIYPGKWEELEKIISYLRAYHPEYVMHTDPRCPYVPGEKVVEFLHKIKTEFLVRILCLCLIFTVLTSSVTFLVGVIFSLEISGSSRLVLVWGVLAVFTLIALIFFVHVNRTSVPKDVQFAARALLKLSRKKIVLTDVPVVVDLYRLVQKSHDHYAWMLFEEYSLKIMESYNDPLYMIPDYRGRDFKNKVESMIRDAYETLAKYACDCTVDGCERGCLRTNGYRSAYFT